jgi:enoyl-CoA hydratase
MADYRTLLVDESDGVTTITVNRPEKMNALNADVLRELTRAVYALGPARAAILTGAGDKAFVAGADIAEMAEMTAAQAKAFSDLGHRLAWHLEQASCPVVAAVNGWALGGGCELALACDFIVASSTARFGQPEVTLGLMPGFGGTTRLPRRVGLGIARQMIYTGEPVSAERAAAIGLVNEVVAPEALQARAREIATSIARRAPLAVAACKRVMARGGDADLTVANELEAQAFSALFGSADQREGTRAFLERRKPSFGGT